MTDFELLKIKEIDLDYPTLRWPLDGENTTSGRFRVLKLNLSYDSLLFFILKDMRFSVFIMQSPISIVSSKSLGRFSKITSSWKASPVIKTLETS